MLRAAKSAINRNIAAYIIKHEMAEPWRGGGAGG